MFNKGKMFECWRKDMGKPVSLLVEQPATPEDLGSENMWENTSGAVDSADAIARDIGMETT